MGVELDDADLAVDVAGRGDRGLGEAVLAAQGDEELPGGHVAPRLAGELVHRLAHVERLRQVRGSVAIPWRNGSAASSSSQSSMACEARTIAAGPPEVPLP